MMALVFFMKGKKYDISESGMDYNLNLRCISWGTEWTRCIQKIVYKDSVEVGEHE